ncbi:phosphatase PAP2 family protein [Sphingoaurantiacus capsulatus]|uniref:Acid phosphatase n=1 Tax=Sphingoaurantiacus capsulatus TaxID=1771310 RepID=A0ABV7XEE2_9SPHN
MLLACAAVPQALAAQTAANPAAPTAYLTAAELPDPKAYLAAPPAPGTPAFVADRAAHEAALKEKDGAGWNRAKAQLSFRQPEVRAQIACALGATLDLAPTTAFGRLMARSGATLSLASEQSKAVWNRDRPYAGTKSPVACDAKLDFGVHSPSYPSGHSATGWLWGLMLAEIAPARSATLLGWGAGVGANRIACGVHYPSDIVAGRDVGAAVYARLQSVPDFRADIEGAKAEYAAAKAKGPAPACATE